VRFGHRDPADRPRPGDDAPIAVDLGLEQAIGDVEVAVDAYLDAASVDRRDALMAALDGLDALVNLGDDYTDRSPARGSVYGTIGLSSVLGARGPASFAEDVPRRVLQAQITLVRRAKEELQAGGPAPSTALREAVRALATARDPSVHDPSPNGPPPPPLAPPPPPAPPPRPGPPLPGPA